MAWLGWTCIAAGIVILAYMLVTGKGFAKKQKPSKYYPLM